MADLKKKIERAMSHEVRDFEKLKDLSNSMWTEERLRIELLESEKGNVLAVGLPPYPGRQRNPMDAGQATVPVA